MRAFELALDEDLFTMKNLSCSRPPSGSARARSGLAARPAIQRHARAATFVVGDLEAIAVQLRDRGDDGKPEPVPRSLVALRATAIEPFQYGLALGARNAGTAVEHVDARTRRTRARPQRHATGGRRELDRVVDEVADRLEQKRRIRVERRQRGGFERERDALFFRERCVELVHALERLAGVDAVEARMTAQVFELRKAQQRAEAVEQRVGIDDAALDELGASIFRTASLLQSMELRTQPRERRAQIVRDVVGDAFHLAEQSLDFVEHAVDDAGEHV